MYPASSVSSLSHSSLSLFQSPPPLRLPVPYSSPSPVVSSTQQPLCASVSEMSTITSPASSSPPATAALTSDQSSARAIAAATSDQTPSSVASSSRPPRRFYSDRVTPEAIAEIHSETASHTARLGLVSSGALEIIDWEIRGAAQAVAVGATFVAITDLNSNIDPEALSFAVTFDVPLFRRTDNSTELEQSDQLSCYYMDETQLMQMLKPGAKNVCPIHALDSVRHDSDFQPVSDLNPAHVPIRLRQLLFTGMTGEERGALEARWGWNGHHKVTLLSLVTLRGHFKRLVDAMTASVQALVSKKVKEVQKRWHGLQPQSRRMSVANSFGERVTSPMWSQTPLCLRMTALSTYPSFDEWWPTQTKRGTLLYRYESSSIGIALRWSQYWDLLEVEKEDIDQHTERWTGGALWTTSADEQRTAMRHSALQLFRDWYASQIREEVQRVIDKAILAQTAVLGTRALPLPMTMMATAATQAILLTPRSKKRSRENEEERLAV